MAPVKKTESKVVRTNLKSPKSPKVSPKATIGKVKNAVISGQLEKKLQKQKKKNAKFAQNKAKRGGIVFLKHLPHGFFEEQIKKYFEQFGDVTRLRLARSRTTGNSKGFAFVEFAYPEVAQVAAETMNNYLMFKKVVKAAYIPPEDQRFNYFKTSVRKVRNKVGKPIYVSRKTHNINQQVKRYNEWSPEDYQKRTAEKLKKIKKLQEKYPNMGIDFTKIMIQPKRISDNTKDDSKTEAEEDTEISQDDVNVSNDSSKQEQQTNIKRKATNIEGKATPSVQQKKLKTTESELAILLGETINEDSDDEDFIAMPQNSDDDDDDDEDISDEATSDEETYGFEKATSDEDEVSDENKQNELKAPTVRQSKFSKVNRFDKLIKRSTKDDGIKKSKTLIAKSNEKKSISI